MSSFVIDKKEYVKAAGTIAGIIEATKDDWRKDFHLYDYQNDRRMTPEDVYNRFVEFFEMNALNVYGYYSPRHPEDELYTDSNEYETEFKQYMKIGKAALNKPEELKRIVFGLRDFLKCSMYQTMENEPYFFKIKYLSESIIFALVGLLYPPECTCWGSLDF